MKPIIPCAALALGLAATMWIDVAESYARGMRGGGGGGGIRAGGMSSVSRGGGGGFSRGSSSMSSRPRASSGGSSFSRPSAGSGSGFSRPNATSGSGYSRTDRAGAGTAANRGDFNRGQGNRGNVNRGDINRGDINRGEINRNNIRGDTNIGNEINIDNDGGWGGWDDHIHHPIAAGMVVGATAAVTAAAVGSVYYSVPTGCAWGAYSYYWCDGYWLEPRYEGDTVVYVNVPDPRAGGAPPPAP